MSGLPPTPAAKAKNRKSNPKAKAKAAAVAEVTPKTADDIKAEVSPDLKISMQSLQHIYGNKVLRSQLIFVIKKWS